MPGLSSQMRLPSWLTSGKGSGELFLSMGICLLNSRRSCASARALRGEGRERKTDPLHQFSGQSEWWQQLGGSPELPELSRDPGRDRRVSEENRFPHVRESILRLGMVQRDPRAMYISSHHSAADREVCAAWTRRARVSGPAPGLLGRPGGDSRCKRGDGLALAKPNCGV